MSFLSCSCINPSKKTYLHLSGTQFYGIICYPIFCQFQNLILKCMTHFCFLLKFKDGFNKMNILPTLSFFLFLTTLSFHLAPTSYFFIWSSSLVATKAPRGMPSPSPPSACHILTKTLIPALQVCKSNLEGKSFYAKNGRPFCKSHAGRWTDLWWVPRPLLGATTVHPPHTSLPHRSTYFSATPQYLPYLLCHLYSAPPLRLLLIVLHNTIQHNPQAALSIEPHCHSRMGLSLL